MTNEGAVSLGRDRKRRIQAAVHHFLAGKLDITAVRELGGWLSFAKEVEPEFLLRLDAKYEQPILRLVCAAISNQDKAAQAA